MKERALKKLITYLLLITMVVPAMGGFGTSVSASGGLIVTQNANPNDLVELMLGRGITASKIKLTGATNAFGTFTGGADVIGFDQGIILSTGNADGVVGNYQTANRSTKHGSAGDQDLTNLATLQTLDAAILEFEFIPEGDKISFQYVFSSEEYHQYANSSYNDVFAFFVNGNNAAIIPDTTIPVSINNVNGGNPFGTNSKNPQYFINNVGASGKQLETAMNGLTVVMSVSVAVNPGVTNKIKIAIADGYDNEYDSNVFIKAGSFNDRPAMPGELTIDSREDLDITIERTNGSDSAISATWTAKNANGGTVGTGVVSFKDGQTTGTITVPGDTVTIELSNPTNGATIAAGSHSKNLTDIPAAVSVLPPTISLNTSDPADSVVVTLSASAEIIEYTVDDGLTWLTYSNPFTINDNVVLKARAANQGNYSSEVTYNITNINLKSAAPATTDITAVGTAGEVTVANVPAGATVIVYDGNGDEIGRGTNTGATAGSVKIEGLTELKVGEDISVSLHESNKSESAKVTVTPVFDRSAAPLAQNLSANATTDVVTVANVPAGAIVTVYDKATGNEIGTATNSGGTAATVNVTITSGLANSQEVEVTLTEPRKLESTATSVTAVNNVTVAPLASAITAAGTAGEVTVANVPAGATVIVYDGNGDEIGRGTNTGATAGSVKIEGLTELKIGEEISVSLHESNKSESAKVTVTPVFERSSAPLALHLSANATTDVLTVANVPAGAIVTVYDKATGSEIGTATNSGGTAATVNVTITSGLANSQAVEVTLTEPRKLESTATSVTAVYNVSSAPTAANITTNGTAAEVTVANVPAGATVIVYDGNGDEIGRGTNTGAAAGSVKIEGLTELTIGEDISVSLHENNKSESAKVTVTPVFDRSSAPLAQNLSANATTDVVTVANVPAGAIVTVYDKATGDEIGTATNSGGTAATVNVTITSGLANSQVVEVTLTEPRKLESTATSVTAVYNVSSAPTTANITTNGTAAEVTVANVPAGATVIVYDGNGDEIGRGTNTGAAAGSVKIEGLTELAIGEDISVSLHENNKSESAKVTVTPVFERSSAPLAQNLLANATTDVVTVANVPAGTVVTVYDKATGSEIGTATNSGVTTATVNVTITSGLANSQAVEVTLTEPRKLESTATSVTAVYNVSSAPTAANITAAGTAAEVTVANVPAGATVIVYDGNGDEIGRGTNTGAAAGSVTIEGLTELAIGEDISVSLHESNKSESAKVTVTPVFERSSAPLAQNLSANATTDVVTVANVPAGAIVTVYDKATGNEIGKATNSGGTAATVNVTITSGLANSQAVEVTLTEPRKLESTATSVTAVYNVSTAPTTANITAAGTAAEVTVANVPAGATVIVYDGNGDEIGRGTNTGAAAGSVKIEGLTELAIGEDISVSLHENNKSESAKVTVTPVFDRSAAPLAQNLSANATTDVVTVANVPAGAIVTVYDKATGNEIGTATNSGGTAATVNVTITSGLANSQVVEVTLTEPRKLESTATSVTAVYNVSTAPTAANITTNGTAAEVTVANVPAGATVIVYDGNGDEVGRGTNTGAAAGSVKIEGLTELAIGEDISVSLHENNKSESAKVTVTPVFDRSSAPLALNLSANATTDVVTVANVPAGAIVTVYDKATGDEIGTATNSGGTAATVNVTITSGLANSQAVEVTLTEPRKLESKATSVTAVYNVSSAPTAANITAAGTAAEVTVANVPAGATVIVYDGNGDEIGRGTNTGATAGSVKIEGLTELKIGEDISVSLHENNKSESAKVTVTPVFERSAAPLAQNLSANATTDVVTVANVSVGAIVTVYDKATGSEIGTATNSGGTAATVNVTITSGLANSQEVEVTLTEPRKLESTAMSVTAVYDPTIWNAVAADIVANASSNVVTVQNVPAGGTITVSNSEGDVIGTAVNGGNASAEITVEDISPALVYQDNIRVTLTIENYAASDSVVVTVNRQTESLVSSHIIVDVLAGRAVIENVPAGAEVIIYNGETIIGRGINSESDVGTAVIKGLTGLQEGNQLSFSVTLPGELESTKVDVVLVLTNEQAVSEAARLLNVGYTQGDTWESVTGSLFLLSVGAYATDVSWISSKPENVVIPNSSAHTITAEVIRKSNEESVILTAIIKKNGVQKTRTFLLIVKALGSTKVEDSSKSRNVQVVDQSQDTVSIPITRINVNNEAGETNSKIDKVIMTSSQTEDLVSNAGPGSNTATIIIDDLETDPADEIAVEIPTSSMQLLAKNGFGLNVQTEYATISLSENSLKSMDNNYLDLFFRLIPLRSNDQQEKVSERLPRSAEGRQVTLLGVPLIIETNYSGYDTTLFLSFVKANIDSTKVNLDMLRIYIEHSDGEKVMTKGTIVRDDNDVPIGISISISKFSTFSIIELKPYPASVVNPEPGIAKEEKEEESHSHSAYIKGYVDGTFRPERQITRAELAALLARNLGEAPVPTIPASVAFKDVSAQHWAASYIEKVMAFGLIIGDENGNFRPDDAITRAEMAMIASRFKQLVYDSSQRKSNYYTDLSGHWAAGVIDALKSANVMNGYQDGTFKPQHSLSRAEAVATINRLFVRGPLYGVVSNLWSDVASTNWAYADIAEASVDHYYVKRTEGGEQLVTKE